MMGETGCGKTSLIKKLSELKNNGSPDVMKTFNIHAGITDGEIIKKIKEYNKEAKKLQEQINIKREERLSNFIENIKKKEKDKVKIEELIAKEKKYIEKQIEEKVLWVFLDEINTCKSMGLISELMCKRTYQGNKIEENIVFIAACNPYRENKFPQEDEIGLNINLAYKDKEKINDKQKRELERHKDKKKLVYTVNPLPHCLLNFVFDFGSLKTSDEYKYIENMIEKPFNVIFNKNDFEEVEKKVEKNEIKKEEEKII